MPFSTGERRDTQVLLRVSAQLPAECAEVTLLHQEIKLPITREIVFREEPMKFSHWPNGVRKAMTATKETCARYPGGTVL